jgi:hypothetical protein
LPRFFKFIWPFPFLSLFSFDTAVNFLLRIFVDCFRGLRNKSSGFWSMRGWFIRVFLTLLTVATITAAPWWRGCVYASKIPGDLSARALHCAQIHALSDRDAPQPPSSDNDGDDCSVCQMCCDDWSAALLSPASPFGLMWRRPSPILDATAVAAAPSQMSSRANLARAPPKLS